MNTLLLLIQVALSIALIVAGAGQSLFVDYISGAQLMAMGYIILQLSYMGKSVEVEW